MLDYSKSRRLWFRIGLLVLILIIGLVVRKPGEGLEESGHQGGTSRSDREQPAGALRPAATGTSRELRARAIRRSTRRGYLLCANLLGSVQAGYWYGISGYDKWGCDVSTRLKVPLHQDHCFNTAAEMPHRGHEVPRGVRWSHDEYSKKAGCSTRSRISWRRTVTPTVTSSSRWTWKAPSGIPCGSRPTTPSNGSIKLAIEFHRTDEERFVKTLHRLRQFFTSPIFTTTTSAVPRNPAVSCCGHTRRCW